MSFDTRDMKKRLNRMRINLFDTTITMLLVMFIGLSTLVEINHEVESKSSGLIYSDIQSIPEAYTGLVLGAGVYADGTLSLMLQDRVDTIIDLYNAKKITRILVSGDHGEVNYDEVNSIKRYLLNKGVPGEDIFLDHAGFDTYDSIYRAKEIFGVTDIIIVTNEFHLPRAMYIADSINLKAYGLIADRREYEGIKFSETRERFASIKGFFDIKTNASPTFLGDKIPITGDSFQSWDSK